MAARPSYRDVGCGPDEPFAMTNVAWSADKPYGVTRVQFSTPANDKNQDLEFDFSNSDHSFRGLHLHIVNSDGRVTNLGFPALSIRKKTSQNVNTSTTPVWALRGFPSQPLSFDNDTTTSASSVPASFSELPGRFGKFTTTSAPAVRDSSPQLSGGTPRPRFSQIVRSGEIIHQMKLTLNGGMPKPSNHLVRTRNPDP